MEPSLRLAPSPNAKAASVQDTSNSLGLHDTLQYGPRSIATEVKTVSPIRQRLENWEQTQDNLKLTVQRNVYGLHAPVRLLMERKIVSSMAQMPTLPQSNLHLDILMGRDETLCTGDFFGGVEMRTPQSIHQEMERKYRV
ncbi:proteasome maturation factor UMP1 [Neolentinus lepideus HHB14362 ss-1]|uniref:Proteasome maturation factor UMP1 n=1 Tax=Neolentinus lepideus HHB14362 ss-1 TaxID=1314782 RepID=A0A165Q9Y9_9AGAM|nr:proteasome maturation factor UMP1 [Neolentinus lepideus HHB14362 ss-1]